MGAKMTATTDDGGQPVLLLKCDGDTALNRDAYMRNVAAGSSSGVDLGGRWNKTPSPCRSGSIGRGSDDPPVRGSSRWCGTPIWSDPRRMTTQT
jgi:hypothetical protein